MESIGNGVSSDEETCCAGCDNLLKELATKNNIIHELRLKLQSIHQTSATSTDGPRGDLSRKFDLTSFILGIDMPLLARPTSFSFGRASALNEREISDGPRIGVKQDIQGNSSSSILRLFQRERDAGYSQQQQQESRHEVRMITFQEIIDKAVDSPKKGNRAKFLQQTQNTREERVITVQEIINNIVDKTRCEQNESCKTRNLESMCDCCNKLLSRLGPEGKSFDSRNEMMESDEEVSSNSSGSSSSNQSRESCTSFPLLTKRFLSSPDSKRSGPAFPTQFSSVQATIQGNFADNSPSKKSSHHRNRYFYWKQYHLENHHKFSVKSSSSKLRHRQFQFNHD